MKLSLRIILILIVAGLFIVFLGYRKVMQPAAGFAEESKLIFVPTGSSFDELTALLAYDSVITEIEVFKQLAEAKSFSNVRPGCYRFEKSASLNDIINKLRSGDQSPIRVVLTASRLPSEVAGKLAQQLEVDSTTLLLQFQSSETAEKYGFNLDNFRTMFIPNTYEMWWNTSAEQLMDRFAKEYKSFWNEQRQAEAAALGLSQSEVTILASIVKAETAMSDEAPVVAGLYLNRLKKGWPLQADPTLIYAHQDFSIKRVLDRHKAINSPYNTYLHPGLPPGPINFPETTYIDAVLQPKKHDYMYMCAKPDLSGYHNFSKTLRQHNSYAAEYQREISRIMREQSRK